MLQAEFHTTQGGGWNCNRLSAQLVDTKDERWRGGGGYWQYHRRYRQWDQIEPAQVDWLHSSRDAKGKMCSHGEVGLGGGDKLELSNLRLFLGTSDHQPKNDEGM